MGSIGTEQYLFAEVKQVDVHGERGLVSRLMFSLALELVPRHYDESDSDRLLHAMTLTCIEGDLMVERDGERLLVGALRPRSDLPLTQRREPLKVVLALAIDLSREQRDAIESAGLALVLRLRGAAEVWSNPLYDHDGYQKTRVGDRGLAEALQAMGCREVAPLQAWEERVVVSEEEWRRIQAELGA